MNIDDAEKILKDIGYAYYFDEWFSLSVDGATDQLVEFITQASKLEGLRTTESEHEAIITILEKFDDDKLNYLVDNFYGFMHERVGGSRAFFTNLAERMDTQIKITKERLLSQSPDQSER